MATVRRVERMTQKIRKGRERMGKMRMPRREKAMSPLMETIKMAPRRKSQRTLIRSSSKHSKST